MMGSLLRKSYNIVKQSNRLNQARLSGPFCLKWLRLVAQSRFTMAFLASLTQLMKIYQYSLLSASDFILDLVSQHSISLFFQTFARNLLDFLNSRVVLVFTETQFQLFGRIFLPFYSLEFYQIVEDITLVPGVVSFCALLNWEVWLNLIEKLFFSSFRYGLVNSPKLLISQSYLLAVPPPDPPICESSCSWAALTDKSLFLFNRSIIVDFCCLLSPISSEIFAFKRWIYSCLAISFSDILSISSLKIVSCFYRKPIFQRQRFQFSAFSVILCLICFISSLTFSECFLQAKAYSAS